MKKSKTASEGGILKKLGSLSRCDCDRNALVGKLDMTSSVRPPYDVLSESLSATCTLAMAKKCRVDIS